MVYITSCNFFFKVSILLLCPYLNFSNEGHKNKELTKAKGIEPNENFSTSILMTLVSRFLADVSDIDKISLHHS